MPKYQAAEYLRLSCTADRENESDSISNQKKLIEEFLKTHTDIELVSEYVDDGYSGILFDRPAFQDMMKDIIDGKINCVIVKDLSRLGREYIETGRYLRQIFPAYGVRFIAITDGIDTANEHIGDDLNISMKNIINEAYAADISKKVKSQARQSMKDGEFIGARPPYGYRKDPDNCHRLLINEDTAPIVRQMFQWMADGTGLNEIVKRLNESGVLTPGYYLASIGIIKNQKLMGSGKWQTSTVSKILSDEVYTGDMVQGKTKIVGHKQVPTPPEEWVVVRGTHEPLISRELFKAVQVARAEKVPYTENILQGRIFCGHCGKNLHRQRRHRNGSYYYHCISNDRIARGACDGDIRIEETDLFETILTIIRREAETVIGKNLRLKQQDSSLAEQKADADREISKLRQETASNRGYLTSLYENLVTGILTSDEYRSMKADYEAKITAAVERMQQLQARQKELERQVDGYSCLADKLAEIGGDTELTSRMVRQLIEQITVNGPADISIQFRFESGFERIAEVLANE